MRINVVGTSGTGKSTFSKKLAQKIGHPYIEVDQLFWGPNWYWPSDEEFFAKLKTKVAGEKWIIDGNYSRARPIIWERIDTIIWLDLPFTTTLRQAITRAVRRCITQEELWPGTGNRETIRKSFFSRDSIILWTLKTFLKNRRKFERYSKDPSFSHIKFVRLKSHKATEEYLANFNSVVIARMKPADHDKAQSFYQSVGYTIEIKPTDIVITATQGAKIVGVVRLDTEKDHLVLRGMQVSRSLLRARIGTQMLLELNKQIGSKECYCLPHDWLEGFYGQIGFKKIPDNLAPTYLQERIIENRKKHPHLIVMHRR